MRTEKLLNKINDDPVTEKRGMAGIIAKSATSARKGLEFDIQDGGGTFSGK